MSLEIKKERAVVRASASGVSDKRANRIGISDPSAPVVDPDPISSWLNMAMRLMLASACDSATARDSSLVLSMRASRAQYLAGIRQLALPSRKVCSLTMSFDYPSEENKRIPH
jgi:hypothetical protein